MAFWACLTFYALVLASMGVQAAIVVQQVDEWQTWHAWGVGQQV